MQRSTDRRVHMFKFWPFTRHTRGNRGPKTVKIDKTKHEEVIEQLFAEARAKAKTLQPGDSFEIKVDPVMFAQIKHPITLIGPVMMRAGEHGLIPGMFLHNTFEFEVAPSE